MSFWGGATGLEARWPAKRPPSRPASSSPSPSHAGPMASMRVNPLAGLDEDCVSLPATKDMMLA